MVKQITSLIKSFCSMSLIPNELKELLSQEEEVTQENLDNIWSYLKTLLESNLHFLIRDKSTVSSLADLNESDLEKQDVLLNAIRTAVEILHRSMKKKGCVNETSLEAYILANKLLPHHSFPAQTRFNIVDVCPVIWKELHQDLPPIFFINAVSFYIYYICTQKSIKTETFKKLLELSTYFRDEEMRGIFNTYTEQLENSLQLAALCSNFFMSPIGQDIMANILSFDADLIKKFHANVGINLPNCRKNECRAYGKIYYSLWAACEDTNKSVVEECFEWFMCRVLKLGRREPLKRNLAINGQALLSVLHENRKQPAFSKVITNLYEPLLWKHLESNNNILRCNAGEILMDVYPLEKLGEGKHVYNKFLYEQHLAMMDLMKDTCPDARVIGIKGICCNMRYFWVTFQNGAAVSALKFMVGNLIIDGSSSAVRRAVYAGFAQLLDNPETHRMMRRAIKNIGPLLHDNSPEVRKAFIHMLLKMVEVKFNLQYYEVVDIHNILARLAEDNMVNSKLLVRLLSPSIFNKPSVNEILSRITQIVKVNGDAACKVAMHSKPFITLDKTVDLMTLILNSLASHLTKKLEETKLEEEVAEKENITPPAAECIARNCNKKDGERMDGKVDEDEVMQVEETMKMTTAMGNKNSYENLNVVHGLLDFAGVLWLMRKDYLYMEANKPLLNSIYEAAVHCLPLAFRYYANTPVYFSALNLATMLPVKKFEHITTITGKCISQLYRASSKTDPAEVAVNVYALCVWNRGGEVLELAKEWMNAALKGEELNDTIYLASEEPRRKKVKFQLEENKYGTAVNMVEELFANASNQKKMFEKFSNDIAHFIKFYSRIKGLISRRVEGLPSNCNISDELLVQAFQQYCDLILLCHTNEATECCNAMDDFGDLLIWCRVVLLPKASANMGEELTDEADFLVNILRVSVTRCALLCAINIKDPRLLGMFAFCDAILDSPIGMHLLSDVMEFAVEAVKLLEFFRNAKEEILVAAAEKTAHLLCTIFTSLSRKNYSKEMMLQCVEDVTALRRMLVFSLIKMTRLVVSKRGSLSYNILYALCEATIAVKSFPIRECEVLTVEENVNSLPFVGAQLAYLFIAQEELSSKLWPVLKDFVSDIKIDDGITLLAVISFLYTLAFSNGKIDKKQLVGIARLACTALNALPAMNCSIMLTNKDNEAPADATIVDPANEVGLNIKEVGREILKCVVGKLGARLMETPRTSSVASPNETRVISTPGVSQDESNDISSKNSFRSKKEE